MVIYCSEECRTLDWPAHVDLCEHLHEDRVLLGHHTLIPTALEDLWAWARFYDTPLKNCAIASSYLRESSLEESQKTVLVVQISHNGRMDVPPQYRFNVLAVGRRSSEYGTVAQITKENPYAVYNEVVPGKEEMGDQYFGTLSFVIEGVFHGRFTYAWMKRFNIDKSAARARLLHREWWTVLRQYTDTGSKMSLPCGKSTSGIGSACGWGFWDSKEKVERRDRSAHDRNASKQRR
ncbi:hypothetical protein V5O48_018242 [Marasmius crinis-equi]|uniref:MYND-type domain-containing protein n=1 Tax=Marasmius crinis-equi TaxID=585013 RepID=A0ABR3ELR6_9AGAR